MEIKFFKMNSNGNDFIIFDQPSIFLNKDLIKAIANRKFGIGCDQILLIKEIKDNKITIEIFNQDGSMASQCGNGMLCLTAFLKKFYNLHQEFFLKIKDWLVVCDASQVKPKVNLGTPKFFWQDIPLIQDMETVPLDLSYGEIVSPVALNLGNPHLVCKVANLNEIDVDKLGKKLSNHSLFPEQINVEFVQVFNEKRIKMRVWERGVGITLSCGSGAAASVIAMTKMGFCSNKVEVEVDGGQVEVEFINDQAFLSGPASFVCIGSYFHEDLR